MFSNRLQRLIEALDIPQDQQSLVRANTPAGTAVLIERLLDRVDAIAQAQAKKKAADAAKHD